MNFKDFVLLISAFLIILIANVVIGSEKSDIVVIREKNVEKEVVLSKNDTASCSVDSFKQREALLIDINKASEKKLISLTGIGPTLAQRIISYRTDFGPFKSVDDLVKIKGIGHKKLAILKKEAIVE